MFDPRLLKNVIKMVDVSYGGEAGFNQAIELSAETLGSVKLVQVRRRTRKLAGRQADGLVGWVDGRNGCGGRLFD